MTVAVFPSEKLQRRFQYQPNRISGLTQQFVQVFYTLDAGNQFQSYEWQDEAVRLSLP